jgi:hypothetical protein
MYGSAALGVTQNYVDAFSDINGYPITAPGTVYDGSAPYENRDPRLAQFVACNGAKMGPENYYTIESYAGGKDSYNPLNRTSRTSYYLRKTLRPGTVTLVPSGPKGTTRAAILLGMPELYLNYAEAAAEAWGPTTDGGGFGFTAADAVKRIHKRYGAASMDTYLNTEVGSDAVKFRDLIHNERRLELAFEGHYFYDLRRWIADDDLSSLNVEIYGMEITPTSAGLAYRKVAIEKRRFISVYQPIPYKETLGAGLLQNNGWN